VRQQLSHLTLPDGARVAYATAGTGRQPTLFIGGWLSHLELSWAMPGERRFLEGLAEGQRLVRYDRPGCGLSVPQVERPRDLDDEVATAAAVLRAAFPAAAGAKPAHVIAMSFGVPVAVALAARHPDLVGRLALYGGWARGQDVATPDVREQVLGLVGTHWGLGIDLLADIFSPDMAVAERTAFRDYQRACSPAGTAVELLRLSYQVDVTSELSAVRAPTLVVHRDRDRAAPVQQAEALAQGIAGAQLVVVPGRSHLPYVGDIDSVVRPIRRFLGLPSVVLDTAPGMTPRQGEIAALVSEGLTNREIARRLGIEERSVEGHLERIRLRLGLRSRAQVAVWWTAHRPGPALGPDRRGDGPPGTTDLRRPEAT
jgi:pimeloyl-ACP methyl ester carboxylesterase/DNA-binding CsgD family transcriptional regulator